MRFVKIELLPRAAKRLGARPKAVLGNPEPKHISTSYVERSNLTMRLMNRGLHA
jgi:hypothetical protein